MESSVERSLSWIETPVWFQIPFVVEGPPCVIEEMEIHTLLCDVEVGFEIRFWDVYLWHALKFSDVRLGA
jgi:hypothetical protein